MDDEDEPLSQLDEYDDDPPPTRWRDRIVDAAMLLTILLCAGVLIATMKMMLVHIVCGLFFMSVACYTVIRGQDAKTNAVRLAWFVCTGATLFLFSYWALAVVFRPPKFKDAVGCGGVKFVNVGENEGALREEL